MKKLGTVLKEEFKSRGLELKSAALRMGVPHSTFYKILDKDHFDIIYLEKAADVLGVTTEYFIQKRRGYTPEKGADIMGDQPRMLDTHLENISEKIDLLASDRIIELESIIEKKDQQIEFLQRTLDRIPLERLALEKLKLLAA